VNGPSGVFVKNETRKGASLTRHLFILLSYLISSFFCSPYALYNTTLSCLPLVIVNLIRLGARLFWYNVLRPLGLLWELGSSYPRCARSSLNKFYFFLITPLIIGDVWWLDRASAFRENLAFVNEHNRVIIKVDNVTSVPFNEKRNSVIVTPTDSVRSTSRQTKKTILGSNHLTRLVRGRQRLDYRLDTSPLRMFGISMLQLILSVKGRQTLIWHRSGQHFGAKGRNGLITERSIPSKASTSWYASRLPRLPRCGVLRRTQGANRYALHTVPGCSQPQGVLQTGVQGVTDCSQPSGCFVTESSPDSYGEGFATAGGGVWATQFDVAGILCVNWVHSLSS
jgi:hypothetical protein